MRNRIILFTIILLSSSTLMGQSHVASVGLSYKSMHLGYSISIHQHWKFPVSVSISSNFTDPKFNDFSFEVWPHYATSHNKFVCSMGTMLGIKQIANFGNRFPLFYWAPFTGLAYPLGKHTVGITVGPKFGRKQYMITQSNSVGTIEGIETYKEFPLLVMIHYSFHI